MATPWPPNAAASARKNHIPLSALRVFRARLLCARRYYLDRVCVDCSNGVRILDFCSMNKLWNRVRRRLPVRSHCRQWQPGRRPFCPFSCVRHNKIWTHYALCEYLFCDKWKKLPCESLRAIFLRVPRKFGDTISVALNIGWILSDVFYVVEIFVYSIKYLIIYSTSYR